MFKEKVKIGYFFNYLLCTEQLSLNILDDNRTTAGKNAYVAGTTKQNIFKVTAAYNYNPLHSNELALQKVICPVFIFKLFYGIFAFSKNSLTLWNMLVLFDDLN